jgi:hypothetical protein
MFGMKNQAKSSSGFSTVLEALPLIFTMESLVVVSISRWKK